MTVVRCAKNPKPGSRTACTYSLMGLTKALLGGMALATRWHSSQTLNFNPPKTHRVHILADEAHEVLAGRHGAGDHLEQLPKIQTPLAHRVHVLADEAHKVLAGRHGAGDQVEELPGERAAGGAVAAALLQQLHVQLVPQLRLLDALRPNTLFRRDTSRLPACMEAVYSCHSSA